jgi:hypothetical protein
MRPTTLRSACLVVLLPLLQSCSLLDSTSDLFNVFSVKFSEGSPPVDGQTIVYSGSVLETPSLDKFRFKMVFHVKADNSGNSQRAGFGSAALKPVLSFRVNTKSAAPISTTIEPFSVAGGEVGDLQFPIEIPLTSIDRAVLKRIVDGEAIPYFLSGSVKFDLLEGTSIKGSGKSELDLASGAIATRPSSSVSGLLSGLL